MTTLNFWLTFSPTIVCSIGRQLSQFTPVSRDYSSTTAVDSRWALYQASGVDKHKQTKTNTNISLPSQLCWQSGYVARKVACCRCDLSHFRESGLYATTSANTSTSTQVQAQTHKHKHTSTLYKATQVPQAQLKTHYRQQSSPMRALLLALVELDSSRIKRTPRGPSVDHEDPSWTIFYKPSPVKSARI